MVVVAGAAAAVLVLAGPRLAGLARSRRGGLALATVPLGLALVAGLAGPTAYALDTVNSAHTGAIPSAGPQAVGFGGGARRRGSAAGADSPAGRPASSGALRAAAVRGAGHGGTTGTGGNRRAAPARPEMPGPEPGSLAGLVRPGASRDGQRVQRPRDWRRRIRRRRAGGSTTVSSALTKLLEQDASGYKWVAATEGSEAAAPLELATGDAVMSIGGFNGTDPWPTLAVFKQLVANHEIHYYVGQGSQSFGGGQGSSAIAAWVAAHFKKQTVGGETVYNLTEPLSS